MKATVFGVFEDLKFKFQKARTKIEVVLSLPYWLSQFAMKYPVNEIRNLLSDPVDSLFFILQNAVLALGILLQQHWNVWI